MKSYLQRGRCLERVARRMVERVARHYAITEQPSLFAHVRLVKFPGIVYLDLLRVDPRYRGLGVAKKLLEEVKRYSEQSQTPVFLYVVPQNEATTSAGLFRLYESAGFVRKLKGEHLPYPSTKDKIVDLIYWPAAVRLPRRIRLEPDLFAYDRMSLAA